jgi:hypothetical protein
MLFSGHNDIHLNTVITVGNTRKLGHPDRSTLIRHLHPTT